MKNILKNTLLIVLITILFFSCKKKNEDPKPVEENELITTVELTFTRLDVNNIPISGVTPIVVTWKDLDGAGSGVPVVLPLTLARNTTYRINTRFLDETKNPMEDKTPEIRTEGVDHQLFFISTGDIFSDFSYQDFDTNTSPKPIGLVTRVMTSTTATSGTLKIVLRHQLNKNAANVSTGDITNAGGSTDVDTTPAFNVTLN